jgi:hypothetical protein
MSCLLALITNAVVSKLSGFGVGGEEVIKGVHESRGEVVDGGK